MCLIMHREENQAPVEKAFYEDVWDRNNDGWGIMWKTRSDEVKVAKGLKFGGFWSLYRTLEAADLEFAVHFRMRTDGDVNVDMCHPFEVTDGVYMMHNGMVQHPYKINAKLSDTYAFLVQIIRPLLLNTAKDEVFMREWIGAESGDVPALIRSHWFKWIVEDMLGSNNRLAFIDNKGITLLNEKIWTETTFGMNCSNTYAYTHSNPDKKWPYSSRRTNTYSGTYGYVNLLVDGTAMPREAEEEPYTGDDGYKDNEDYVMDSYINLNYYKTNKGRYRHKSYRDNPIEETDVCSLETDDSSVLEEDAPLSLASIMNTPEYDHDETDVDETDDEELDEMNFEPDYDYEPYDGYENDLTHFLGVGAAINCSYHNDMELLVEHLQSWGESEVENLIAGSTNLTKEVMVYLLQA